ncbi:MAG: hypothetical protein AAF908_03625 [Pseudomonadota bacterium]
MQAPFEKLPVDEATLFGVPLIVWLIIPAVALWLWGEWQKRRRDDD